MIMSRKGLGTVPVDPKPTDILSGRGKATYTHPGNKRYLQAINSAIEEYVQETTKVGKTAIVRGIVQQMSKEKRRFLQRDSATDNWYELGRKAILDKVGHSLRDMKQTRILHKAPGGSPDGEKGMVPADGKMTGGGEGGVVGDDKMLGGMGFQGQRMDPAAVARLQQNYLGTYGGFSGLGGVGGLVPPVVDPHMLAARSRALALGSPPPAPPMPPGPGGAPVAPPPIQPPQPLPAAPPQPPPPQPPQQHLQQQHQQPPPVQPQQQQQQQGAANKTKLDAILETTNMILKEREAIRALSAQGAFAPSALGPSGLGSPNAGATGAPTNTTNNDGRAEEATTSSTTTNNTTATATTNDASTTTSATTQNAATTGEEKKEETSTTAKEEPEKPTDESKPPAEVTAAPEAPPQKEEVGEGKTEEKPTESSEVKE